MLSFPLYIVEMNMLYPMSVLFNFFSRVVYYYTINKKTSHNELRAVIKIKINDWYN